MPTNVTTDHSPPSTKLASAWGKPDNVGAIFLHLVAFFNFGYLDEAVSDLKH